MDPELEARLAETRQRLDRVTGWMDRQARTIGERAAVIARRLDHLEQQLKDDLLRLHGVVRPR